MGNGKQSGHGTTMHTATQGTRGLTVEQSIHGTLTVNSRELINMNYMNALTLFRSSRLNSCDISDKSLTDKVHRSKNKLR